MSAISATAFRKDLFNTIDYVIESHNPVAITKSNGNTAVLVGEDDWSGIQETLYLHSVPGLVERILEADKEPLEQCTPFDEIEW